MLLNVNIYANSVIESSFALMKFMEVLMNIYLPYSFNCSLSVDVNECTLCVNEQQKGVVNY